MTEWWVSQKKHFCEYCKVWTGGHLWQIKKHEDGRMHIEKKEAYLRDTRIRAKEKEKEEDDVKRQLAEIERAAAAAMGICLPAGGGKSKAEEEPASFYEKQAKKQKIEEGGAAATSSSSAAPSPTPQAPVSAGEGSPWLVVTDPNSGQVYYFNKVTKASVWEKPADLGIDLSKPPPPPAQKPPPPPAKKGAGQNVGGWVEVSAEESMWNNADEREAATRFGQEEEEVAPMNRLGELNALKREMGGRMGEVTEEDKETHQKETFQKRSQTTGKATFGAVKKASGIRKKPRGDDD